MVGMRDGRDQRDGETTGRTKKKSTYAYLPRSLGSIRPAPEKKVVERRMISSVSPLGCSVPLRCVGGNWPLKVILHVI